MNGLLDVLLQGDIPSYTATGYTPQANLTGQPTWNSNISLTGNDTSNSLLGNLFGDMDTGNWMNILGGLGNMYFGNKQFGLLEDVLKEQLGMTKEKWGMTKDELSRVNAVRNNLNSGYRTGNYAPSPRANTYGRY